MLKSSDLVDDINNFYNGYQRACGYRHPYSGDRKTPAAPIPPPTHIVTIPYW